MNKELIFDRYRIIQKIGNEQSGVFLGKDTNTNTDVIIKKKNFKNIANWDDIESYNLEVDILRQLEHKRIPKLIDAFTIEKDNGDTEYYLIREYIEGLTLKEKVYKDGVFSEVEAIEALKNILDIISYLHNEFSPPVIHRDINPDNFIITASGFIYLVDFGSVKDLLRNDESDSIVGTEGYIPVEQTRGKSTQASDIYGLGMTIIYSLSGKNPSKLPLSRAKPDIASCCDISPSLVQSLELMIEPVVEDRLQSVEEVKNELRLLKASGTHSHYNINNNINKKYKDESDLDTEQAKDTNEIFYDDTGENLQVLNESTNDNNDNTEKVYNINDTKPAFIENDPIFRSQRIKRDVYKELENYVDEVFLPANFNQVKLWKDFDSMTFYFKSSSPSTTYENSGTLSSTILLVPLIMLFVYIGIETFMEPFFVFAMVLPLFVLFMRNMRTKDTNSIQLKSNYIKIVRYKSGRPESRIIGYYDIKDIYIKETEKNTKLIILLKTDKIIEVDTDLSKNELKWIVNKSKEFIKIAMNYNKE
ncbi:MAG: serine/threonine protein kinase [Spirochaetota bacterium]